MTSGAGRPPNTEGAKSAGGGGGGRPANTGGGGVSGGMPGSIRGDAVVGPTSLQAVHLDIVVGGAYLRDWHLRRDDVCACFWHRPRVVVDRPRTGARCRTDIWLGRAVHHGRVVPRRPKIPERSDGLPVAPESRSGAGSARNFSQIFWPVTA